MAWDYSQDPYQTWYPEQPDQYWGYDPYYTGEWYEGLQPEEDTASEKLRKEQEEQERLEAIESNKLFLRKVRKQCVKEDFVDLQKVRLFLFEVLIESLQVNTEDGLGLVPEDTPADVNVKVQFLDSPYLEIGENDLVTENISGRSIDRETEYARTVAEAGWTNVTEAASEPATVETQEEENFSTKWANENGKSCLFSMSALEVIQNLERYPVNIQVTRSVTTETGSESSEPIGYAQVRLPDDFSISVIQSCRPGVILPVSSVHRETCDVKNVFGVKKGKLEVFVRLSSFGPAIITSFRSTGTDRNYVFKPSPMSSEVKEEKEDVARNKLLSPVFAEEEKTVGISIRKDDDIFQKPVLWRSSTKEECFCYEKSRRQSPTEESSGFESASSLGLPLSEVSLCRDVMPPTDHKGIRRFGTPLCDWHNLVSLEIKNSPGGNCGCIEPVKTDPTKKVKRSLTKELRLTRSKLSRNSRMEKLGVLLQSALAKSFRFFPPPEDCHCDCPTIKENLAGKKLFSI